jgi:diguanylate cyclase (GGDEF)-like protein
MAPTTTFNDNAQSWQARSRVFCLTDPAQALRLCADPTDPDACSSKGSPKGSPEDRALRLNLRAIALETLGEVSQAEHTWLEFRSTLTEVDSLAARSHLELTSGRIYWQHGLNWRALEEFRAVHARALVNGNAFLMANALNMIAQMHDVFDEYSSSLEVLLQALPIHQQVQNIEGEALANYLLGVVYDNQGMKMWSLEHFQEAVRLVSQIDHPVLEADCLKNLGEAWADAGDFDRALGCVQRAFEIACNVGDAMQIGEAHLSFGRIDAQRDSHASAVKHFERALRVLGPVASVERLTNVRLDLAESRLRIGLTNPETVKLLERALNDSIAGGTKLFASTAHQLLADCHERNADPQRALDHMKRLRCLEQELSDERAEQRFQALSVKFGLEQAQEQASSERSQRQEIERVHLENLRLLEQLREQALQLEQLAMRDALTGLFNRRAMDAHLNREFARSKRMKKPLCLAVIDIDHFKTINDRFSHAIGDEVLRVLASIFMAHARASDQVARIGGEEFVIVMAETSLEAARVACERVRLAIKDFAWETLQPGLRVTASVGIGDQATQSPNEMLAEADRRLYQAKHAGRNQVV